MTDPNTTPAREKWLDEGYRQFAVSGPNQLSINQISRKVGASRASFYHHFGDIGLFVEELLARHWDITEAFNRTGRESCRCLFPDLYNLLGQYPIPLQFSLQLFHHRSTASFNYLFIKSYEATAKRFALDLFARHFGLIQSGEEIYHLWLTLGEAWYSRLDPADLSGQTLQGHAEEILRTLSVFVDSALFTHLRKTV